MKKNFYLITAITMVILLTQSVVVSAQSQHWIGDGGRGRSITVMTPQTARLPDSLNYLPVLVQGELVSNFSTFSAIDVFDRQTWEKQQAELMSEAYDASAEALINIGRQAPTQYFLTGNISQTRSGYALQLSVIETAGNNTVVATYSGTSTFDELDNLTSVRRASLELLQKMGVTLTAQAQTALAGAATSTHVNAQTALSRGIVAQRQGTEVAALSYFYQASALDTSLLEAVRRSSVMSANIFSARDLSSATNAAVHTSSATSHESNLGGSIRGEIERHRNTVAQRAAQRDARRGERNEREEQYLAWRNGWRDRLVETEVVFHRMLAAADPPYTLVYFTNFHAHNIDHRAATADLSISLERRANTEWFAAMGRALGAASEVFASFTATELRNDWEFRNWPQRGLTNRNPFNKNWNYEITIVFELVNQHDRVIGRQTVRMTPSFEIDAAFNINYDRVTPMISLTFNAVSVNHITDNLTIRVASVNRKPPETARFPIIANSTSEDGTPKFSITGIADVVSPNEILWDDKNVWDVDENGVLRGFIGTRRVAGRRGHPGQVHVPAELAAITDLVIPGEVNGRWITAIAGSAFEYQPLNSVTIPSTVRFIGGLAFIDNGEIRQITIGPGVSVDPYAFSQTVQWNDRHGRPQTGPGSIGFFEAYEKHGRAAGTYTSGLLGWRLSDSERARDARAEARQRKREERRERRSEMTDSERTANAWRNVQITLTTLAVIGLIAAMVVNMPEE